MPEQEGGKLLVIVAAVTMEDNLSLLALQDEKTRHDHDEKPYALVGVGIFRDVHILDSPLKNLDRSDHALILRKSA